MPGRDVNSDCVPAQAAGRIALSSSIVTPHPSPPGLFDPGAARHLLPKGEGSPSADAMIFTRGAASTKRWIAGDRRVSITCTHRVRPSGQTPAKPRLCWVTVRGRRIAISVSFDHKCITADIGEP